MEPTPSSFHATIWIRLPSPSCPGGVAQAGSPKAKGWRWRTMRRNPGVYVRGRIRHPDHATVTLHGWHRVVMNTEGQSRAMQHVAFLD